MSVDCVPDWPDAAAGVELSPVAAAALEELELVLAELETAAAGAVLSAGAFAVPEPFRPASTVPLVEGRGAGAGVSVAGVLATGCSEVG